MVGFLLAHVLENFKISKCAHKERLVLLGNAFQVVEEKLTVWPKLFRLVLTELTQSLCPWFLGHVVNYPDLAAFVTFRFLARWQIKVNPIAESV